MEETSVISIFIWTYISAFVLLFGDVQAENSAPIRHHDYIVIGAGPAGLQMGYFLQQAGRDYIVMERASTSGSFFTNYPRHNKLISINKRNTGKTNKEFNLRHDWNSLVSHDESLLFRHYSKKFFPPRATMVRYLNDFSKKLNINIQYLTRISEVIRHEDGLIYMKDHRGQRYNCRTLIVATGLWKPVIPDVKGKELLEGYESVPLDPDDFEGQNVLILGKGNTAYEVAEHIYGNTNSIHFMSRGRVRLSWETHYVGDLRAVNNGPLDTYQLKSLDGLMEAEINEIQFYKKNNKIFLEYDLPDEDISVDDMDNNPTRDGYDRVIRCLGWMFDSSIFAGGLQLTLTNNLKYPEITPDYQSTDIPGIYYAGTLTHSLDHRKSAGGFIHGFRYTVQALHRLLEWSNHAVPWPSATLPINDLQNYLLRRINEASEIYQMFSVLGDVISISHDGSNFTYFEAFPIALLDKFDEKAGFKPSRVLVMILQYGQNFSGPGNDVFRDDRATAGAEWAHLSNFLHPVFYYYKELPTAEDMEAVTEHLPPPDLLHHTVEDFLTTFMAQETHILPLRRFLEEILQADQRNVFSESCLQNYLTSQTLPPGCQLYISGKGLLTYKM